MNRRSFSMKFAKDECRCKGCPACNSTLEFEIESNECFENEWEGALCFSCLNYFDWKREQKVNEQMESAV